VLISHYFAYKSDFTQAIDYEVYDFIAEQFPMSEDKNNSSYSIMVDIDEKSLQEMGQWPWPRVVLADLISKIDASHPAAIGLDIIFPEKDRTSPYMMAAFYQNYFNLKTSFTKLPKVLEDNDLIFSKVLQESESVLSIYLSHEYFPKNNCDISPSITIDTKGLALNTYEYALCNTPLLQQNNKHLGFINTDIDKDGVLRRIELLKEYNNIPVPSFSLAVASELDPNMSIQNKKITIFDTEKSLDKDSSFLLTFYKDGWYKKVSAIDILHAKVPVSILSGKIVLVGSSSIGLHDQVIISGGTKSTGTKIHMTALDNILNGTLLTQPNIYKIINIIFSIIVTLLLFYLIAKKKNIITVLVIVTSSILFTLVVISRFHDSIYISAGYFYLPFIVNFMIVSIAFMIIDMYEKKLMSEELDRSHVALLDSMVHVAEVHDIETGAHIIRTKKYIKVLGEHLHKKGYFPKVLTPTFIKMMYRTAPLHDIGKVGIEDAILKKPGKLTFIEYEVMKTHPDLGRLIIENAIKSYEENNFFEMAKNIAYTHHEKWDGSGYPEGLMANEIPLEGRFMAIADVYDALVSRRVYKESFSYEDTYRIIQEGRGAHFDPILVDAFFEIKEEFRRIAEEFSDEMDI